MIRHFLLTLALAAGLSSAAQAQQVFTVASCSNTGVSNAPGTIGRFYAGPDGVLCVSGGGGGGGGAANSYPGSDYATSARQDAQTAALGAPADAAYTGSGNAGNVALGKGQYAILSNLSAAIGAAADTASTATGANGSQVALLKALRDKLNGSLAVTQSGTWTVTQGAAGSAAWKVDGSAVTQPVSAANLPLPAGAATSANQVTELSSLATIATKAAFFSEFSTSTSASQSVLGAIHDLGATPAYSRISAGGNSTQAGTLNLLGCYDSACAGTFVIATQAVGAGGSGAVSYPVVTRYWRVQFVNGSTAGAVNASSSATAN